MEDGRSCRKCSSRESTITAFMLTCRHCKRHWHHSCLEPKMRDAELVSILNDLKTRADDEVWACRRCFLRNGGQPVQALQRTSSQILSAPSTSSKQIGQVADRLAARKTIVAEVLDDDDDDDIVMLHDPPPPRIDTTAARTMIVAGAPDDDDDIVLLDDFSRSRTNVTKNSGPQSIRPAVSVGNTSESDSPSGSIRHINFHSIPRPSNRPRQAQAGVQTRRIEDDTGISDVELIEDSDGLQVAERTPSVRAGGYSRSQASVSGVPPTTTGLSGPPALPAYQSSLGPSNKRIVVSESATSSRASSSTTTSRRSTYDRSIPSTSPSASRSVSLNTSFDQMNIEKTPSSVARSSDGPRPPAISTPTPSTMSSISNTVTPPDPRDKTPMPVNIRERIAHMRAQGLLKPPPSILDDLTANSQIEHGTIARQEHPSVRGLRSAAEQVEVKLELRDSDEEIPTRSSAKAKGKRPVQLPIHAAPSLVRSVHKNVEFKDSDVEDDEWEELFERISTKRTRRLQEASSITSRKFSAVKAKRLGPKARENTDKRTLQWVMSSVPTDSRKRELPSWMI
ncbi:hypothetical protein PHLGIDRAFT_321224 [Phlebiopsis gigantea 11061_1 CR5-6]|uniref:PHD-type domain-containing protein n=1 Tax=Phlebiopsis gigantea (strain 11061_1 CR5-6) TaxID=745531 RepID=A0A0C3RQA1_PHLG1|nr:hypothetical protein PHLGIDRAFT_321224 [Phlebiopsis gigantea 11061_1 CR5-6]